MQMSRIMNSSKTNIFFSLLLLGLAWALPASSEEIPLDHIVAVVDDDVVMASELEKRVADIYARLENSETEIPAESVLIPQVLERLILERLQLNRAQRMGIRISDEEVTQAMERMAESREQTVAQMIEDARQSGIDLTSLRQQLRNEITINQVQERAVNRRIYISEQEVDNFLASEEGQQWSSPDVNLGHILLPLSSGASREDVAEVEQKVRGLYEQLQNGADFKSLAIAHSGAQDALQGGDLGWRKTTQLPSIFVNAVDKLSPGEVSMPIRSDAGYHLLKLYDRRGGGEQIVQQHKVRHILLKPNEIRSEDDTRTMLEGMRADILGGADFAELARKHSEDIGTALGGGDLGWSLPGQFVPEFEQIMGSIDTMAISEPFRTQFGWHILQVTERRRQDFSDEIQQRQAENIIRRRKFDEEQQIWLREIRDEAFVDIKL
ncbi:MAG: peptidyl-prolyl cis-trans isomerase SurA [Porticoccus sp.]|jgi:peptidyl-prolyl cis-trans isomerase SurA|tara:strand:- start:533 stop:1843 length:1311 start_codon:yes stop_codon:yes gene_type:complete